MIPNQPGTPVRSLLAAAVLCAFLVPSTGARAEEPSPGSAHEGLPATAESSAASDDAAVPPTTSISWTWIGSTQDSARINVRFSRPVTGFHVDDIDITCTDPTAGCAEAVPLDTDTGRRFAVKLRMPQDYDGSVIAYIPANQVQDSTSGDGNIASNVLTIDVDTKGPEVSNAKINGDEVAIVFDEDLNQNFVPSASDFQVSFLRSGTFNVKTVSQVEMSLRDVFLLLDSPVDSLDAVRVFYDNRGAAAIRDRIGNRASGFDIAGGERHRRGAHRSSRRTGQPHGYGRWPRRDRTGVGRAEVGWRPRNHRVPDRGVDGRRQQLEQPGSEYPEHRHRVPPHGSRRGRHAPLPGFGDQFQRRGRPLQRGQRHHG